MEVRTVDTYPGGGNSGVVPPWLQQPIPINPDPNTPIIMGAQHGHLRAVEGLTYLVTAR